MCHLELLKTIINFPKKKKLYQVPSMNILIFGPQNRSIVASNSESSRINKYPSSKRAKKRKGRKRKNYRADKNAGRPVRLSINYTVIGYRGARLCGWTAPITSPWPKVVCPPPPPPPPPRGQSHGTSPEGFECHSTIIIAARVMYHVIVHGDSGSAAFTWTEEDATFRYPTPALYTFLFPPDSRGWRAGPIISAFIAIIKEGRGGLLVGGESFVNFASR